MSVAMLRADEGAFDIKGSVSSLTVLRLRSTVLAQIEAELMARVVPYPQIFMNAPVVIDAAQIEGELSWTGLAGLLRAARLVPVAATNLGADEAERAVAAGFGLLSLGSRLRAVEHEEGEEGEEREEAAPEVVAAASSTPVVPLEPPPAAQRTVTLAPLVVAQPVRGGQVIYARNVDLVARAPVNVGAQVIADGSIHIWAPLRGRALAGAQGQKDARIFCMSLEAELISVAGEYVLADEIPAALRGKPAQVFLDGDRVRITAL